MPKNEWPILIVDDEPDVLSISRLAMKNFTVYDLPIKLYTARSKAEALEILAEKLTVQGRFHHLAVAFIDVVMETDSAGLELCEHIRRIMQNHLTQLFIRTGQPGLAPEREVIDKYDINGYFTKVEATEDKLYSLVKSGVRQFYSSKFSLELTLLMNKLIAVSNSRKIMQRLLNSVWLIEQPDEEDNEIQSVMYRSHTFANGESLGGGLDQAEAIALRDRLDAMPGVSLYAKGDKYVRDDQNNVLVKISAASHKAEVHHIIAADFAIPDIALMTIPDFWASFARLWYRAA